MGGRKTTLTVDDTLIAAAAEILGTNGIKRTIDAALHAVIVADARHAVVEQLRSMRGLDLDKPEVMAGAWRD